MLQRNIHLARFSRYHTEYQELCNKHSKTRKLVSAVRKLVASTVDGNFRLPTRFSGYRQLSTNMNTPPPLRALNGDFAFEFVILDFITSNKQCKHLGSKECYYRKQLSSLYPATVETSQVAGASVSPY